MKQKDKKKKDTCLISIRHGNNLVLTLCGQITGYPVFSILNMSDHSRDIPFLEHDKMQQTIAISCALQLQ
jgi:hypothetical protein